MRASMIRGFVGFAIALSCSTAAATTPQSAGNLVSRDPRVTVKSVEKFVGPNVHSPQVLKGTVQQASAVKQPQVNRLMRPFIKWRLNNHNIPDAQKKLAQHEKATLTLAQVEQASRETAAKNYAKAEAKVAATAKAFEAADTRYARVHDAPRLVAEAKDAMAKGNATPAQLKDLKELEPLLTNHGDHVRYAWRDRVDAELAASGAKGQLKGTDKNGTFANEYSALYNARVDALNTRVRAVKAATLVERRALGKNVAKAADELSAAQADVVDNAKLLEVRQTDGYGDRPREERIAKDIMSGRDLVTEKKAAHEAALAKVPGLPAGGTASK